MAYLLGMRVDLFDFELPKELIAQRPARPRDLARLLVVGASPSGGGDLDDRMIRDLPRLLAPGDLLVLNDTRVIPARLTGRRGQATIEVTLLAPPCGSTPLSPGAPGPPAGGGEALPAGVAPALARPARRLRVGDRIVFAPELAAEVLAKAGDGEVTLGFDGPPERLMERLERHGAMPLPPYVKRPRGGDPADRADYQTLFACHDGAVAAPTAGLHFTAELVAALGARGIDHALVTLHVGAGTFQPVKALDTRGHVMHGEGYTLPAATAEAIARTRRAGGQVVAVGTTVLRTLETVAALDGQLRAAAGWTRLFVTPGHRFRIVDRLLTNLHLPRSTLFMLVAAFAGLERMQRAYRHAVEQRYRFHSYGDACLLDRVPVEPR